MSGIRKITMALVTNTTLIGESKVSFKNLMFVKIQGCVGLFNNRLSTAFMACGMWEAFLTQDLKCLLNESSCAQDLQNNK